MLVDRPDSMPAASTDSALRGAEKLHETLYLVDWYSGQRIKGQGPGCRRAKDGAKGAPQLQNSIGRNPGPAKSYQVQADCSRGHAIDYDKWRDIHVDLRPSADEGELSDAGELVHNDPTRDECASTYPYVSGECGIASDRCLLVDGTVVGDVRISHQVAALTDPRGCPVLRASMHGRELANNGSCADLAKTGLRPKLCILRLASEHCTLVHLYISPESKTSFQHGVRADPTPCAHMHIVFDHYEGADIRIRGQIGPRRDNRGGMDGQRLRPFAWERPH